ncbi:MAG: pilus assembly protein PilP [Deltaproteobacteria bacterium]|nr:pilus assembly protein PilP [Deltaproteobacteria bacterium]
MTWMTARSILAIAAVFGLCAVGTAGCAKEEQAPQQVVKKMVPKEQPKPAEGAKPLDNQAVKPAAALYSPAGKRDPFVPFVKVEPKDVRARMEGVPPLQRYDLGELKFVGVIWGPKAAYALVEDAEGKGYTVTVGTKIGRGGGTVQKISDGEMVVKEEHRDNTGAVVVRRISLKLQSAGGN